MHVYNDQAPVWATQLQANDIRPRVPLPSGTYPAAPAHHRMAGAAFDGRQESAMASLGVATASSASMRSSPGREGQIKVIVGAVLGTQHRRPARRSSFSAPRQ